MGGTSSWKPAKLGLARLGGQVGQKSGSKAASGGLAYLGRDEDGPGAAALCRVGLARLDEVPVETSFPVNRFD
eukprot:2648901-Pyramimonas_sp.AAC.1